MDNSRFVNNLSVKEWKCLRIIEMILCLICFGFSLRLWHLYGLRSVVFILLITSFLFFIITTMDVIAGTVNGQYKTISWCAPVFLAAFLFFLCFGLMLFQVKLTNLLIGIIFLITGLVFLIDGIILLIEILKENVKKKVHPIPDEVSQSDVEDEEKMVEEPIIRTTCTKKYHFPITSYGGTFPIGTNEAPLPTPKKLEGTTTKICSTDDEEVPESKQQTAQTDFHYHLDSSGKITNKDRKKEKCQCCSTKGEEMTPFITHHYQQSPCSCGFTHYQTSTIIKGAIKDQETVRHLCSCKVKKNLDKPVSSEVLDLRAIRVYSEKFSNESLLDMDIVRKREKEICNERCPNFVQVRRPLYFRPKTIENLENSKGKKEEIEIRRSILSAVNPPPLVKIENEDEVKNEVIIKEIDETTESTQENVEKLSPEIEDIFIKDQNVPADGSEEKLKILKRKRNEVPCECKKKPPDKIRCLSMKKPEEN